MKITLISTDKRIPFTDVNIGHPFKAHDRFWVRTSYDAAAELGNSTEHTSVCNYVIDPADAVVTEVIILREV